MSKKTHPDEVKQKALELVKQGQSNVEIAEKLDIPWQAVVRWKRDLPAEHKKPRHDLEREVVDLRKKVQQLQEALEVEATNYQALTEENLRLRGELEKLPRGRLERVKQSLLALPAEAREKVVHLVNLEAELRREIEGAA